MRVCVGYSKLLRARAHIHHASGRRRVDPESDIHSLLVFNDNENDDNEKERGKDPESGMDWVATSEERGEDSNAVRALLAVRCASFSARQMAHSQK